MGGLCPRVTHASRLLSHSQIGVEVGGFQLHLRRKEKYVRKLNRSLKTTVLLSFSSNRWLAPSWIARLPTATVT